MITYHEESLGNLWRLCLNYSLQPDLHMRRVMFSETSFYLRQVQFQLVLFPWTTCWTSEKLWNSETEREEHWTYRNLVDISPVREIGRMLVTVFLMWTCLLTPSHACKKVKSELWRDRKLLFVIFLDRRKSTKNTWTWRALWSMTY